MEYFAGSILFISRCPPFALRKISIAPWEYRVAFFERGGIHKISLRILSYLVFQGRFRRLCIHFSTKIINLQMAVFMLGNISCSFCKKNGFILTDSFPREKKKKRKKTMDHRSLCLPHGNLSEKGTWDNSLRSAMKIFQSRLFQISHTFFFFH